MSPDLSTFAKVRALHDRTDSPGEKAAAAGRMEALARAAGMSVAEAVSRVDAETSRTAAGVDWSAFAEEFWKAEAATADAPDARSRRWGLPIYDPDKIEHWRDVAVHCLSLDWIIPKARGGKFLTKDERARLKAVAGYAPVTNATADWIETVLSRCHAARDVWCEKGDKAGARPDRQATRSNIEKAAELVAAAKRREAAKLDEAQGPPAAPRNPFEALFNSPEFRAQQAERQRRDAERRAAALAEYGSEDAVFAETEQERALDAACRPLIVRKPIIGGDMDTLLGWDFIGGGDFRPEVREAVAAAYDLPVGPREAWEEWQGWDRLYRDREAFFRDYGFPVWVEARRHVVEELLNEAPARSMNDLRARLSWIDYLKSIDILGQTSRDDALLAALRADIERMGARLREQDAADVQSGQGKDGVANLHPTDGQGPASGANPSSPPDPATSNSGVQNGQGQGGHDPIPPSPAAPEFYEEVVKPAATAAAVQSGHVRRTNADKRRDVAALLDEVGPAGPLTDREIARRAGVSPTTVGTIRRAQAARPASP